MRKRLQNWLKSRRKARPHCATCRTRFMLIKMGEKDGKEEQYLCYWCYRDEITM